MDMQLTREKRLEFASLADPRFTLSRFYREPIYRGWVAMLEYYVPDDDGVFQSAACASVVIKESELEQLRSIEQLNALVRERVLEANASLVALVDVPYTLESQPDDPA